MTNLAAIAAIAAFLVLSVAPLGTAAAATTPTISFGAIQNLTNDPAASTAPVVATVGSHVYVAWESKPSGSGHRVTMFTTSSNNGGSWSTPVTFTGNGLSGSASPQLDAVQIATSNNYVYLTWEQGGQTAYAANSNFGAGTLSSWTYGVMSVAGTSLPSGPMAAEAVTATSNYAYFTWADNTSNILFSQIHDTGNGVFSAPSTPKNLVISGTFFSAHGEDESASVTVGSTNYVYVVWDSIFFTVSSDNGQTFATPVNIKPTACVYPCLSREPMISASGNYVYVTYPSDVSGPYQTYIVVNNNLGNPTSWGSPQLLSGGLSNTREVQVTSNGNNVYVTSRGTSNQAKGTQQYVYISNNNGGTFAAPLLLGSLPGSESGFGGWALDPTTGAIFVQWPHNSPSQLYVSGSKDLGAHFSAPQQVSKSTGGVVAMGDPGGSQGPLAAALSNHLYFVWEDDSTGSGDIYFVAATYT
jgi:hypothetical protein